MIDGRHAETGDVRWKRLASSNGPAAAVLIRFMVGAVFLSEGLQKFLFPDQLGAGRFLKIGLPMPQLLGPFVGTFEMICGVLVLRGLLTRLAVIPLLVIMAVALTTTKWPMLDAQGTRPETSSKQPESPQAKRGWAELFGGWRDRSSRCPARPSDSAPPAASRPRRAAPGRAEA